MRSVGIDIGSSSYAACGLVVDGEIERATLWSPNDKKDSDPVRIEEFYNWLTFQLGLMRPDIVAVEQQAGFVKNHNVIRSLSKREGVALLAARKRRRVVVLNPPATQARGVVFKKGNISKDDAWEAFKKMYPNIQGLKKKTVGGTDQMDAIVHALAAPTILERR